jgi:hypothetical protein
VQRLLLHGHELEQPLREVDVSCGAQATSKRDLNKRQHLRGNIVCLYCIARSLAHHVVLASRLLLSLALASHDPQSLHRSIEAVPPRLSRHAMTELDQLVRSLARAFDNAGSTSKTALRKVLQDHIRRLHALRAIAKDAEVESFYTVAAWYLTKPYLLKQDCVSKQDFAAEDLVIIDESRRVKAINTLNQAWGAKAIDTVCHLFTSSCSSHTDLR